MHICLCLCHTDGVLLDIDSDAVGWKNKEMEGARERERVIYYKAYSL